MITIVTVITPPKQMKIFTRKKYIYNETIFHPIYPKEKLVHNITLRFHYTETDIPHTKQTNKPSQPRMIQIKNNNK